MNENEEARVRDIANNMKEYLSIVESKNAKDAERLRELYSEWKKAHFDYIQSLFSSASALLSERNALKQKKIDPYIAGGAANGVFGGFAGLSAGLSAYARNQQIDENRENATKRVSETRVNERIASTKLSFQTDLIYVILDKYPEVNECRKKLALEKKYTEAKTKFDSSTDETGYRETARLFKEISGYKDADEYVKKAETAAQECHDADVLKWNKIKKTAVIVCAAIAAVWILVSLINNVIVPSSKYSRAMSLSEQGDYKGAIEIFEELGDYKDSKREIENINNYQQALDSLNKKDYDSAIKYFTILGDYKDSNQQLQESIDAKNENTYLQAIELIYDKQYSKSRELFQRLGHYKDSKEYLSHFYSAPTFIDQSSDYSSGGKRYEIEYDEYGNISFVAYSINHKDYDEYRNIKYDNKGRILEYSSNKPLKSVYKIKYNSDGSAVKTTKNKTYTKNVSYDKYGNPEKFEGIYHDSKTTETHKNTLDKYGNIIEYSCKSDTTTKKAKVTSNWNAKITNNYSDVDCLVSVKVMGHNYTITYGVVYFKYAEPDTKTIIENLKRISIIEY